MKDSDRKQKVENWRLGEQLRGIMKAIIKKRDLKSTEGVGKHRPVWLFGCEG